MDVVERYNAVKRKNQEVESRIISLRTLKQKTEQEIEAVRSEIKEKLGVEPENLGDFVKSLEKKIEEGLLLAESQLGALK